MSAQIADFNIRFNAESAKFQKDVDYAKKMLRGYTKEAKAANDSTGAFSQTLDVAGVGLKGIGGIATATAGAIGLVTAGIGGAATAANLVIRNTAQQAREIERMATVAQVSVEEIQALGYATEQYSISGDKMADILKDVNDKLGDFVENEGGEFADFMNNIAPITGLTIEKLQALSGPEALIAVKNAMDAANVPMKSQIFYLESIANDASALMPLLENKGKRLYELKGHYDSLNVAMSQYDIEQYKQIDQQIGDMEKTLSKAFGNLSRQVTYALLPTMDSVTMFVTDLTKEVGHFTNGVQLFNQQLEVLGSGTATWNLLAGKTMRQTHRELFADIGYLKDKIAEYKGVAYDSLPSVNPFGKSKNELNNLQRDLAMKQDQLKRINDAVIEQKKLLSQGFQLPSEKKKGDGDDKPRLPNPSAKNDELLRQQEAGKTRLSSLDMQYANERDKLLLAHEQRLADIRSLKVSEQELARRGFETLDAMKAEYKTREDEFYVTQQEEYQRRQDEAIQRELEAFARKEEEKTKKAEQAARQRADTEKRFEQQVMSMKFGVASQGLALIEQTAREGSIIQKAAFAAQKGMAAAQVYMQGEVAATAALSPPPIGLGPIAGVGQATAIRALAAASAGLIMGQAIAGMAHSGIGEVPREGTWLLDKGERVYTNYSAQQIDQMYKAIMAMYRQPFAANDPTMAFSHKMAATHGAGMAQPWQVIIHEAPPGTTAEIDDEKKVISIMMKDANSGGQYFSYISQKLGVKAGGYK